jgi:hypothetical protein
MPPKLTGVQPPSTVDFSATSPMPNYAQMQSGGTSPNPLSEEFKAAAGKGGPTARPPAPKAPKRATAPTVNVTILHLGRALDKAKPNG